MSLITSADFPAIRALLDATMDATILPDAVIDYPPYHPRAEAVILRKDPIALTRTDPAQVATLKLAAIYLTASYLMMVMPTLTPKRYQLGQLIIDLKLDEWKERSRNMQSLYAEQMSLLLTGDDQAYRARQFTTAQSGRAPRTINGHIAFIGDN